MHVVTAAHDFYPDGGSGGTGRYVYETSRGLVARGHRVSVVTRRRDERPRRAVVDGIDVYRYDLEIAERNALSIFPDLLGAHRTVAEHVSDLAADSPPDVLSAQGPITSLLVARSLRDVPVVPVFHSPWPVEYRIRTRGDRTAPRRELNAILRRVIERGILFGAEEILVLSEFMRDELRRVYGSGFDATVVPGGVDVDRFVPDAAGDIPPIQGEPSFLTVRRLAERMGHELLLDAFAIVVDRRPAAKLYVAGDGPLRDRLERVTSSRDLDDHVTFLGYVPDPDLPAVYAAADLFVLPTLELEGFGLATLEALASGTPVVGTPVGGTVEILSDLARRRDLPAPVLAADATPDSLAEELLAWCDLPGSTVTSAGRACRQYACERYTWDRTVSALESAFADVVS